MSNNNNKIIDKFNTIGIIITNNEAAFEGFPEAIESRDGFLTKRTRISEIKLILSRPYTESYDVKSDSRNKLFSSLSLAIGTGISIARKQNNQPLLVALKKYKSSLSHIRFHDLPEMASRVLNDLQQYETQAKNAGLTEEKLADLQVLTTGFGEAIATTNYDLTTRKTLRDEMNSLIKECKQILQEEIDPFVAHCESSFPDFFKAYTIARATKRRPRKKRSAVSTFCDISGTVTDNVTKLPVVGVTLRLDSEDTVYTTDEDGYYSIEEVKEGYHKLSCFANGYEVPETIQDTFKPNESIVIDFSLVPAEASAA